MHMTYERSRGGHTEWHCFLLLRVLPSCYTCAFRVCWHPVFVLLRLRLTRIAGPDPMTQGTANPRTCARTSAVDDQPPQPALATNGQQPARSIQRQPAAAALTSPRVYVDLRGTFGATKHARQVDLGNAGPRIRTGLRKPTRCVLVQRA